MLQNVVGHAAEQHFAGVSVSIGSHDQQARAKVLSLIEDNFACLPALLLGADHFGDDAVTGEIAEDISLVHLVCPCVIYNAEQVYAFGAQHMGNGFS